MATTRAELNDRKDGEQQEPVEGAPQRYTHIWYKNPDSSGRYHEASAWVGTLEQIVEHHRHGTMLPYQYELFGGQDVVTLEDGKLSIISGNGLFEVFDLGFVTQAIPGLTVVHAVDEFDFRVAEMEKIRQGTYTREDERLWNAHEALKEEETGELGVVALVRGPIPYSEELVCAFLEDKGLLGTNSTLGEKYTLSQLEDNGRVFDSLLVADGAVCWVHDIGNEPLLPFEDYWVPADEWRA